MKVNAYKAALEARRAELTGQDRVREGIVVERLSDPIDEVQQTADRELAILSLNRNWAALRAIDQALDRLQDGSFGVCQNCEETIGDKRLQAVPWTALCLRCQELADAEDGHPSSARMAA